MVKKVDIEPFLAACILFLILNPYFSWAIIKIKMMYVLLSFLISLLFIKNNEIKKDTFLFSYLFFVAILFVLLRGNNINGFIMVALSVFLPFGKFLFLRKVFSYFINIYTVFISLSAIVWLFVLMNMIQPIGTLEPLDPFKTYNYNVYPLVIQINNINFYRFCGLFDEPGVVGTFNAILLYIIGFERKNWKTYALLISGLLSFSLFFYLSVCAYFVIKAFVELNIKVIFLTVFFSFLFYGTTKDNDFVSEMIWSRIEWDSSKGSIVGDNRAKDDAEELYNKKRNTREYWFGINNTKELEYFEGSSTYKFVVLSCGMVCFLLYVMFFVLLSFRYMRGTQLVLFLFLLFATIYQRPWMFGMGYLFLFPYYAKSEGLLKNKI